MTQASTSPVQKLSALRDIIRGYGSILVAYSGGADSAFLAAVAHQAVSDRCLAVTARSPSLAESELEQAVELAGRMGWRHHVIDTKELEDPRYVANDSRRCFFCKNELYTRLTQIAAAEGLARVANGSNVDDLGDYRPGLDAAAKFRVSSPLVDAGLKKEEIRTLSRDLGLPTWDKPAQACLSSRIPYGAAVSVDALNQIAQAEAVLRELGFRQVRVRHHDRVARIEVPAGDIGRLAEPHLRRLVTERLRAAGYLYVTLDLSGFRSGSLNDALPMAQRTPRS